MFATEIGTEEVSHLLRQAECAQWEVVEGRDYQTAFIDPPQGWNRAFFIKLPPGGRLHRHTDTGDCETHHIVVQTNDGCVNFWEEDGENCQHMAVGKRYTVDRTLMHWAVNNGLTDRIHLMVER